MRTCARSGCNSPAVATLSYDRIALVAYLVTADDPAAREPGDLCERHTAKLVLPRSWQLDDRRAVAADPDTTKTGATMSDAVPARAPRAKKLRVVKESAEATPTPAKAARAKPKPAPKKSARTATRRKWAEPEPSLFDATDARVAPTPTPREPDADEPVWMPRFDDEPDGVLDAKTPMLRRAFGGS